jgi:hypothetical protein
LGSNGWYSLDYERYLSCKQEKGAVIRIGSTYLPYAKREFELAFCLHLLYVKKIKKSNFSYEVGAGYVPVFGVFPQPHYRWDNLTYNAGLRYEKYLFLAFRVLGYIPAYNTDKKNYYYFPWGGVAIGKTF